MLKKLFFKYDKKVNEETNISYFTPTANIILINENESFETSAMIDSGADISVMSKDVAEILRLKLGKETKLKAFGGEVKCKETKINIILKGKKNQFQLFGVKALVVDSDEIDFILGREGIFNNFLITFDENNKKVIFEKVNLKNYKF